MANSPSHAAKSFLKKTHEALAVQEWFLFLQSLSSPKLHRGISVELMVTHAHLQRESIEDVGRVSTISFTTTENRSVPANRANVSIHLCMKACKVCVIEVLHRRDENLCHVATWFGKRCGRGRTNPIAAPSKRVLAADIFA